VPSNGARALAAVGADVIVATDPFTVAWLTGFAANATGGPSPFATTAVAIVSDGGTTLICSSDQVPEGAATKVRVEIYEGSTIGPLEPGAGAAAALARIGLSGRIAVEPASLPVLQAAGFGDHTTVDVTRELQLLRAVKTASEIDGVRRAIALCDVGQAAARRVVRPGMSELEVWSEIQGAMQVAAGERIPVLADLLSGTRTAEIGGGPSSRVIGEGDLLMCDLGPRTSGLWGDSCSTVAVGTPPDGVTEAHARAVEALELLISEVKPGLSAAELDAIGRGTGLGYPHHTGHGVGFAYHEEPRIVPGSTIALEPGMVIALEPGTYRDDWGLRVEWVVLVTETGCDVLSTHSLDL
jgi:Xaa-Pro dipeptidase